VAWNEEYSFISTDTAALEAELVATYEQMTGRSVSPASPERLFIQWLALILLQERVLNNYTGNQNIPSRAEGRNLDALGELFHDISRPQAKAAVCTMRFTLSAPQQSATLIPKGTRVTDSSSVLVWETIENIYVDAGEMSVEIPVQCQTVGTIGNDYIPGQINTLVDLFPYYATCENVSMSGGGANGATDKEYYELMRLSMDGYSCAGAKGGYIYFAKQASTSIADVVANGPEPGHATLYVLMNDGIIASEEVKKQVLAACSADERRPFTDLVSVEDPEVVPCEIQLTYYLPENGTESPAELQKRVEEAVNQYKQWQCAKLGRDINPSYLIGLLMQTGVKRVDLTKPVFTALRNGNNNDVPQIASISSTIVMNGGLEHD